MFLLYKICSINFLIKKPVLSFTANQLSLLTTASGKCQEKEKRCVCLYEGGAVYSKQANVIQNIYLYENAADSILCMIKQNRCPCAHSKLLSLSTSPVFFLFQFQTVSHLLTFRLPLPPLQVCWRFSSFFFFFSLSPSAYKPEPALLRSWRWRESGKGVIMMSIHKHHTLRDCMDETTNATGKLPTQPGKVVCYTVEQSFKKEKKKNLQTPAYTPKAKWTHWCLNKK